MSESKRYKATGIVLKRVDYGEYDRIITFLTEKHGKVSAMVKGVRKPKSRLAGGIELFSVSDLVFLEGRGDLDHVVSSRLVKHYRHILDDYDRMRIGYRAIELIEKLTEDEAGEEYFELLKRTFEELDDTETHLALIESWYYLQLLILLGRQPNLKQDSNGAELEESGVYLFHPEDGFVPHESGNITVNHIKTWRLLSIKNPHEIRSVGGLSEAAGETVELLEQMLA